MSNVTEEQLRGREEMPQPSKGGRPAKSRDAMATMEARVTRLEVAMADCKERLNRLEQNMEDSFEGLDTKIEKYHDELVEAFKSTTHDTTQESMAFQAKILEALANIQGEMQAMKASVEETKADWALCKRAVASGVVDAPRPQAKEVPRAKDVPKPKEYDGKRDATIIDNFLWHMERYFAALDLEDKVKVNTASLYFTDIAMVWWRRKCAEMEKGTLTIDSWDTLKAELKKQFYPENVGREARKKMKELKHDRSIQDYVRTFSDLMLQITNMSEEDLLFNFMDGLKPWAAQELKRYKVEDIATALTVAESLVEYRPMEKGESSKQKGDPPKNKGTKPWHAKGGGAKEGSNKTRPHADKSGKQGHEGSKGKKDMKPREGCFLCGGPHWARDCPKRKALTAMLEQPDDEGDDGNEATMGCLKLLNALKVRPTSHQAGDRSLIHVEGRVNGKDAQLMVDTSISHNFVSTTEARRLGLKIAKTKG